MSEIQALGGIHLKNWGKNYCFPVLLPCQKSFELIPLDALVKKHSKKVAKVQRIFQKNTSSFGLFFLVEITPPCILLDFSTSSQFAVLDKQQGGVIFTN